MQLRDTVLVFSDISTERARFREIFRDRYNVLEAHNRKQLALLLNHNEKCIAAIIVKAPPPENKSESVITMLKEADLVGSIPVILILPKKSKRAELLAYEDGATDVITEPCDDRIIFKRIENVVSLSIYKNNLETLVEKQAKTLKNANDNMVDALSAIIEYRSAESGKHVLRVRHYVKLLLNDMAISFPEYGITEDMIDKISGASSLHDIGKVSIPDSILNKPNKLTEEEFSTMKHHTTNGAKMVETLVGIADEDYLRYAYNICLHHHERWDGRGYPAGLKGDEIPLCAQVTGLADVYDVLTTERVYKAPYQHNVAINMILNGECGAFNPKILESFKNLRNEFISLARELSDDSNIKSDELLESLMKPMPAITCVGEETAHSAYLSMPKSGKYLTSQALQAKYQSLIHYTNATIIEVDLVNDSYHIVFNPFTDFKFPSSGSSFSEALNEAVATMVHPDDRGFEKNFYYECEKAFNQEGLRRFGWTTRIYQPSFKQYFPWKTSVIKVGNENSGQNDVLVIIEPVKEQIVLHHDNQSSLQRRATMYDISGSVVCYKHDAELTLVDGIRNLYNLLGYTMTEVKELFDNKLINMVVPEDRAEFTRSGKEQLNQGTIVKINHRMFHKDGSYIWVQTKAKLVVEKNGQEYIYSTLNDNTEAMKAIENFRVEAETNRIIIDQSEGIVFEWDSDTDYLNFSSKWEKRFGYIPRGENFSTYLKESSRFHPDDTSLILDAARGIIGGNPKFDIEVRILDSESRYIWNRVSATAIRDNSGRLVRIVGIITDIHNTKSDVQNLKRQSEEDGLTKLLNRNTATSRIKVLLDKCTEDSVSAMLLIDIDNFKAVNDNFGHLFGDKLLVSVAEEIRNCFRAKDIVSRVGGDEFLVFINNINEVRRVEKRVNDLLLNLRILFANQVDDAEIIGLSASIGIALIPKDGTSFLELYEKADKALYNAKRSGKNQYSFAE